MTADRIADVPDPRRRGNATYYPGNLRRDLLDAALAVVASEGPAALNLRALARQLGVSHAAPANHFPDKSAVFTAIAREGFELLWQAMHDAAAALPADESAAVRFRAAGLAYMRFAVAHRAHFEVMWRNDLLQPDDPGLVAAGEATFAQLLAGVRDAQSEGWASGADTRTVAHLAWATMHGLAGLWLGGSLSHDDDRSFDDMAQAVSDLLGAALAHSLAPSRPLPGALS